MLGRVPALVPPARLTQAVPPPIARPCGVPGELLGDGDVVSVRVDAAHGAIRNIRCPDRAVSEDDLRDTEPE